MSTFEDQARDAIRALADHAPQHLSPPGLRPAPSPARFHPHPVWTVAAIAAAAALVAVGIWALPLGRHPSVTVTSGVSGGTATLPPGPLGARYLEVSAWTGQRWLIWGGIENTNVQPDDGASYDPSTRRWTMLPPAPLAGRQAAASVWTGKVWIVYGGSAASRAFVDGATYDPRTNRWQRLPPGPSSLYDDANVPPEAVWTGTSMIVIAGSGAASYDPTTRRWAMLPTVPGQSSTGFLTSATAAWTGSQAVFLLGSPFIPPAADVPSAAPSTHTKLPPVVTPQTSTSDARPAAPMDHAPAEQGFYLAAYTPRTGRWTVLPAGGFSGDILPDVVWTGRSFIAIDLWSHLSKSPGATTGTSASYDPATHRWTRLPPVPAGPGIGQTTAQWTGNSVLLWDGGARVLTYTPSTNSWSSFTGAPRPNLQGPATAWTGRALLVWGGLVSDDDVSGTPLEVSGAASYVPAAA